MEGLPTARIVAHLVRHAALQPIGIADPTVLGKVLEYKGGAGGMGWAASTQTASPVVLLLQFLLAGITRFCL